MIVSGGDSGRGQCVAQMPGHQGEVVHGDATALMHLLHRRTGIWLRPAQSRGKEFRLFAFETAHIRSGEEAGELVVGEHPSVEILDDDLDRLVPADLVVDGDWRALAET